MTKPNPVIHAAHMAALKRPIAPEVKAKRIGHVGQAYLEAVVKRDGGTQNLSRLDRRKIAAAK